MRYVATFYPRQTRLQPTTCSCDGMSGRLAGCFVVMIIYVTCALGNMPAFHLFRAIPIPYSTAPPMTTVHPFLDAGFPITVLPSLFDGNQYYIDLGSFSHQTRRGLIFHWVKFAINIFIPGILLTSFNIRLIQALRQSERLRHVTSSLMSGGNVRSLASRNRLNVTLIAVIVMLVCLVFPCEFLDFVVHLTPFNSSSADCEALMLTRMFLNALQLSNFALNFFLYCTINAQFRQAIADWFCHHRQPTQRLQRHTFRTGRNDDHILRRNDDVNMSQRRTGVAFGIRGGAYVACQSPMVANDDRVVGSHVITIGQQQSGSHSSHSNGPRTNH